MALTYDNFLVFFPEFTDTVEEAYFDSFLPVIIAQTNGYIGLKEELRDFAIACYFAMILDNQAAAARGVAGGAITGEKTRDDEIKYAPSKREGITSTNRYGGILHNMLWTEYSGGCGGC